MFGAAARGAAGHRLSWAADTSVGLAVPNLNLQLSELAHPDQRGGVLSGLVTGIFLGQFLSPLAVQPFVEISLAPSPGPGSR